MKLVFQAKIDKKKFGKGDAPAEPYRKMIKA
jgi:hypothetical protein